MKKVKGTHSEVVLPGSMHCRRCGKWIPENHKATIRIKAYEDREPSTQGPFCPQCAELPPSKSAWRRKTEKSWW